MNLLDTFPNAKGNKTMTPALRRCEAVAGWNVLTAIVYQPDRGFFALAFVAPETAYLARSLVDQGFLVTDGRAPLGHPGELP